jgi:hypothetical protein
VKTFCVFDCCCITEITRTSWPDVLSYE